jgi:hypothetical protein
LDIHGRDGLGGIHRGSLDGGLNADLQKTGP